MVPAKRAFWHTTRACGHHYALVGAQLHCGSRAERPLSRVTEYWSNTLLHGSHSAFYCTRVERAQCTRRQRRTEHVVVEMKRLRTYESRSKFRSRRATYVRPAAIFYLHLAAEKPFYARGRCTTTETNGKSGNETLRTYVNVRSFAFVVDVRTFVRFVYEFRFEVS